MIVCVIYVDYGDIYILVGLFMYDIYKYVKVILVIVEEFIVFLFFIIVFVL